MRTIGAAGTFLILLGVLAAVPVQAQTPPGICDRTQQVQDGILNWLSGVSDCAEVTTTHLTTVTELTLESVGLTSLRADDFAGLTDLKELRLTSNKQLWALPSGVFSGLAKLETLDLYNNQFYQGLPSSWASTPTAARVRRRAAWTRGCSAGPRWAGKTRCRQPSRVRVG